MELSAQTIIRAKSVNSYMLQFQVQRLYASVTCFFLAEFSPRMLPSNDVIVG